MLILWNKMYQEFYCYSDLKDVKCKEEKEEW